MNGWRLYLEIRGDKRRPRIDIQLGVTQHGVIAFVQPSVQDLGLVFGRPSRPKYVLEHEVRFGQRYLSVVVDVVEIKTQTHRRSVAVAA